MNAPRVPSRRCHWMWLGMVLFGAAGRLSADIPAPRVLTAHEWAGVQAAHEDPRPAVRKAAEELMQQGASGRSGDREQRIGGYIRKGGGTAGLAVPFTVAEAESLPQWTRPSPESSAEAALPPAATAEEKWERMKQEVWWHGPIRTELNPTVHAPLAVALLKNENPALVWEALEALSSMEAPVAAPQIAPLAFHRDEHIAAEAIYLLGKSKAKDQADMLAVLAETRPAVRRAITYALTQLDDKRAVPLALDGMRADRHYYPEDTLRKLAGPEHGPTLAACLTSEVEHVVLLALDTLGAVKAVNEAEAVARLLEPAHDLPVRRKAIETLGELGARQFSGRITALMTDNDLAWECAGALGKMQAREHAAAVLALLEKAQREPTGEALQVQCVRALYRMGSFTRTQAVRKLESVVRETDFYGWHSSASLFIELDAVESLEALLRLRGTPIANPSLRDYESPPDALSALGFGARCSEIAWFLQSPEPAVVIGALKALLWFGAVEYVPEITALLARDEPDSVKLAVLESLRGHRLKPDAAPVAALLDSGESLALRKEALSLLEQLEPEGVVAQVAALLLPEEPYELRSPALKLFAGLKGAEPYADKLVVLTKADLPAGERIEALQVLLEVSPARGLPQVEEMLRPGESGEVRGGVLTMLQRHPSKPAAPFIAALLAEESEEILAAALDALQECGGDAEVEQVLPVLRHPDWNMRRKATEVLCRAGVEGRRRLLEITTDPVLRGMAVTAMLGEPDGDAAKVIEPGSLSPEALIARAEHWATRRERGTTTALAESLQHDNPNVRAASREALMVCGEGPNRDTMLVCLETALRLPEEAGPLLRAAYLFAAPEERMGLPWLGSRPEDHPAIPHKVVERAALLSSLWRLRVLLNRDDVPYLRRNLPQSAAVLITSGTEQWTGTELPLLESVAEDMQQMPWVKESVAAEVAEAVGEVRANTPLRRALRWSAWILGGQLSLWVLVLLLYPWSALAQRMTWSRTLRRGLGWWVEPLVLRTPWLRDRMWRPFREQLVPPGEVLTFDEWTFFDAVRIAPEGGAPCAALPLLRLWRGVGVLRGESGLGKTTLLQALVSAASRPAVLLRAVECGEGLTAAIQARLPQGVRGDAKFLRALLVRGSPDVYVDAVQEAPAEVQARLTKDAESLTGGNILFTTQPCAWAPPAGAMVWDVQPLRAADIAPFLLKQGTAAIEAAGGQSLAERQAAFTARVQTFLDELSALPENDPRAVALIRMLSNPMEAVLAAELLAAGQTPDPARLLAQRMEHLEEDFAAEQGGAFPAHPLAAHLLAWRQSGRPDPDFLDFSGVASFLARHRLLRKTGETGWRFRHDKILDWFLRPVTAV